MWQIRLSERVLRCRGPRGQGTLKPICVSCPVTRSLPSWESAVHATLLSWPSMKIWWLVSTSRRTTVRPSGYSACLPPGRYLRPFGTLPAHHAAGGGTVGSRRRGESGLQVGRGPGRSPAGLRRGRSPDAAPRAEGTRPPGHRRKRPPRGGRIRRGRQGGRQRPSLDGASWLAPSVAAPPRAAHAPLSPMTPSSGSFAVASVVSMSPQTFRLQENFVDLNRRGETAEAQHRAPSPHSEALRRYLPDSRPHEAPRWRRAQMDSPARRDCVAAQ